MAHIGQITICTDRLYHDDLSYLHPVCVDDTRTGQDQDLFFFFLVDDPSDLILFVLREPPKKGRHASDRSRSSTTDHGAEDPDPPASDSYHGRG